MSYHFTRRTFFGLSAATVLGAQSGTPILAVIKEPTAPQPLEKPLTLEQLNTPALVLDADAMERNLQKMMQYLQHTGQGVGLRPHSKTHKCPIIAKRQLELGAVGICCAKVSEAEVMLANGIETILITSPVVTSEKIERVIALSRKSSHIQIVIDNEQTARDFDQAAQAAGITQRVLIDLNTGTQRTGITLGKPAVELAHTIGQCKNLQFDGLQAYSGHLMHVPGHKTRRMMAAAALKKVMNTKAQIENAGFNVGVVTGGGTGTFDMDGAMPGFTDLQAGSYLFMDAQYREIGSDNGEVFDYFEPSLFVVLTAISQPVKGKLMTMDGGFKAFASDSVVPEFVDAEGLIFTFGGDEHAIVRLKNAVKPVHLGDKFKLIISHCDPTVNLYDHYHVFKGDAVRELWPIAARGCSQ